MIEYLLIALIPAGILVAGFLYGKFTDVDDIETVNDAVANAQEFRESKRNND